MEACVARLGDPEEHHARSTPARPSRLHSNTNLQAVRSASACEAALHDIVDNFDLTKVHTFRAPKMPQPRVQAAFCAWQYTSALLFRLLRMSGQASQSSARRRWSAGSDMPLAHWLWCVEAISIAKEKMKSKKGSAKRTRRKRRQLMHPHKDIIGSKRLDDCCGWRGKADG